MKTGLRTGGLVASMCLMTVMACAQSSPSNKGVAIVNGETITDEQVQKEAAAELARIEQKREQFLATNEREKKKAVEDALTEIVTGKALAAEAKKRSLTIDELVRVEVQDKLTVPSEEAVRKFYEDNKARIKGTFIETALDIRNYLMEEGQDRALAGYLAKLRRDYGFRSMIEPARTTVVTQGHPSKGPANAPVTIVEFSDFECPFCNGIIPTLKAIEENYKDKIRVVYRQFPLNNIHPRAQKAAEASLCANEQGKFWEFHDALFADQQRLTVDDLKAKAAVLSMNGAAFAACLDSGKHAAAVRDSIVEGSKAGVDGTPALFINGRFLAGNQPYAEIEKIIDDELARLGK
jgi:predicted DsbA family dithiol-disulfide isomerase/Skp family chaperone for outer membrane proteins